MLNNKKGQELSINTIIIAVLVVVVLIVVIVFFVGGFTGISEKLKIIFFGSTAGADYTLAISNCESWCTQAKSVPANLQYNTAYCKTGQYVDMNNDGEADKDSDGEFILYKCEGIGTVYSLDYKCTPAINCKKA